MLSGNRGRHMRQDDRVFLEGAFRCAVAFFVDADSVCENAISYLEASNARSDLDYPSGEIGSQHKWVFDP